MKEILIQDESDESEQEQQEAVEEKQPQTQEQVPTDKVILKDVYALYFKT